jgi:hypothetical protein
MTRFALDRLFDEHERWIVRDALPATLVWIGSTSASGEVELEIDVTRRHARSRLRVAVTWDWATLDRHDPDLRDRTLAIRQGRSIVSERQKVTEFAGYGLALVATSLILPGRRIRKMTIAGPPDLLFDDDPGALRGVEVAARTRASRSVLASLGRSKTASLRARTTVAEAWLSLWSSKPRVSLYLRAR